jgi:hypothetical protein
MRSGRIGTTRAPPYGYGQFSPNFTAFSVTGRPLSFAPAFGLWVHTCQFDSTSTHRLAPVTSFTVMELPESRASRAAFTLLPWKSGIVPRAADGAAWSCAGQVSASLTAPKSSSVFVAATVPASTF